MCNRPHHYPLPTEQGWEGNTALLSNTTYPSLSIQGARPEETPCTLTPWVTPWNNLSPEPWAPEGIWGLWHSAVRRCATTTVTRDIKAPCISQNMHTCLATPMVLSHHNFKTIWQICTYKSFIKGFKPRHRENGERVITSQRMEVLAHVTVS